MICSLSLVDVVLGHLVKFESGLDGIFDETDVNRELYPITIVSLRDNLLTAAVSR